MYLDGRVPATVRAEVQHRLAKLAIAAESIPAPFASGSGKASRGGAASRGTLTHSMSARTQIASFARRLHGVVVHASSLTGCTHRTRHCTCPRAPPGCPRARLNLRSATTTPCHSARRRAEPLQRRAGGQVAMRAALHAMHHVHGWRRIAGCIAVRAWRGVGWCPLAAQGLTLRCTSPKSAVVRGDGASSKETWAACDLWSSTYLCGRECARCDVMPHNHHRRRAACNG